MSAHPSSSIMELELQSFEVAFEALLAHLGEGRTLDEFCRIHPVPHSPLHVGRFRGWIFASKRRREAYYVAKAVGAEALEDELVRISDGIAADGSPALSDVGRDTLRINTRKWLLQISNRKRYGDVKHIESTITEKFDPSGLSTAQLEERIMAALGLQDSASLLEYTPDNDDS